jgi:hypothetical protein
MADPVLLHEIEDFARLEPTEQHIGYTVQPTRDEQVTGAVRDRCGVADRARTGTNVTDRRDGGQRPCWPFVYWQGFPGAEGMPAVTSAGRLFAVVA